MELERVKSANVMTFLLKDGNSVVIHQDDIEKISKDILHYCVINKQENVLMLKDTGLERANFLYDLYTKEKESMTKKQKETSLSNLIKLITENNYELTSLKQLVEEHTNKNKSK